MVLNENPTQYESLYSKEGVYNTSCYKNSENMHQHVAYITEQDKASS
jgi:hypothetical protein